MYCKMITTVNFANIIILHSYLFFMMRILKIYLLSFQIYNTVWLPIVIVLYITSQNVYLDVFAF